MTTRFQHDHKSLLRFGSLLLLVAGLSGICPARAVTLAPVKNPLYPKQFLVPIDKSHAGQHRALAMLAYVLYQKGEMAEAAAVARILECEWDRVETGLKASSPALWKEIDDNMDEYIRPIITYAKVEVDSVKLKAAYDTYLTSLAKITD